MARQLKTRKSKVLSVPKNGAWQREFRHTHTRTGARLNELTIK